MLRNGRNVFFLIFTASGFAGLIYESIWTHYLKLFLGHAAYAQTLVLAVFMGGMALGSWLCARYSKRWHNLLLGYALVEAIIGVCAVLFHPLYVQFLDLAYTRLIPGLGSPVMVTIFKWTAASLLILPQSILLGMTFPLMTAGVIRRFPGNFGATVAMLYFTNSIGAAVGVLASGFLFIAWAGLPGALVIAGVINITVAAIVWLKVREDKSFVAQPLKTAEHKDEGMSMIVSHRLLLAVALLTGASSFIYEIGWIRMLNLVLSSSTHAFELMLSAFILGLALGGLWIRRRIDSLDHPIRFLAYVQMAMGILALATMPLYGHTFEVMAWLIKNLDKTVGGYRLFNIASHGMAMTIMLPATFCAGMTLPLITTILLRCGYGEKSVGTVYALNTVGCIIGVFFAVHFAMPLLGLKGMLVLGAGVDIALGLALAWRSLPSLRLRVAATAVGAAVLLIAMIGVTFEPHKMASGVYRSGIVLDPGKSEVLYHYDGKTATVSVTTVSVPKENREIISIRTNGKPDASIEMKGKGARPDEATMVLAAALPLALHPRAKTAANIGWGSGLTTHTLLSTRQLDRVDSIEIEPAMIEAAKLFRPRVDLAYTDPRSHIHIEDAKTFFSIYKRKYDIIVSEPSNPWVSGVAGLFSEEFYQRIKDYLNKDGILVQWIQLYEIDLPLISSVFKALSSQFADYAVYAVNNGDILIIARPEGAIPEPDPAVLSTKGLSKELKAVGINGLQDVLVRRIGNRRILDPLFDGYDAPANSDYYPLLDLFAARARFMGFNSMGPILNELALLPAVQMLGQEPADLNTREVSFTNFEKSSKIHVATMLHGYITHGQWKWDHPEAKLSDNIWQDADILRQALSDCSGKIPPGVWWDKMFKIVVEIMLPASTPNQLADLWQRAESSSCWSRLSPPQRDFITMLKAVDRRSASEMARTARKLLQEVSTAPSSYHAYFLAVGMLGDLSQGKAQDARLLWKQYESRLDKGDSQSLLIRLLVAHMENSTAETHL